MPFVVSNSHLVALHVQECKHQKDWWLDPERPLSLNEPRDIIYQVPLELHTRNESWL